MKMLRSFGLIVLLLVLVAVGWLSTRQVAEVSAADAASAPAHVRQQIQQIQQQLDNAAQTRRDLPDDAK